MYGMFMVVTPTLLASDGIGERRVVAPVAAGEKVKPILLIDMLLLLTTALF